MPTPVDLQIMRQRLESGQPEKVRAELEESLERFPGHVAAHVLLATTLEQLGDLDGALSRWRKSFQLCPDSPVILERLRNASREHAGRRLKASLDAAVALEPADADGDYSDIDLLIQELETARIVPDPTVEPAAEGDLDMDVDDVASETLARIYANQKFYSEAARVYEKLASQQPERAEEFRGKAAEIRERLGR